MDRLQEHRGTGLPGLALSLGDILQRLHVGLGLGQDVVEIVSDGDEDKALLDELGNAISAEQEQAENLVVPASSGDHCRRFQQPGVSLSRLYSQLDFLTLIGGGLELSGEVHLGELVLLEESHAHAQVVLAQEEHVDTIDGGDSIHVLDGVSSLDLESDEHVLVRVSDVSEQTLLVGRTLTGDRT